jgi:hypothetical protein
MAPSWLGRGLGQATWCMATSLVGVSVWLKWINKHWIGKVQLMQDLDFSVLSRIRSRQQALLASSPPNCYPARHVWARSLLRYVSKTPGFWAKLASVGGLTW